MFRWAEWVVLVLTMAFVIDGSDSRHHLPPLYFALSQFFSTGMGMLLPFTTVPLIWAMLLICAVTLFSVLFVRTYNRAVDLKVLKHTLPNSAYHLCKAKLGLRLSMVVCFFWSGLVMAFSVDTLVRLVFDWSPQVQWGFCADCVIDAFCKMWYTSLVDEDSQAYPTRFRVTRGLVAAERMEMVWTDAHDVIVVSQRLQDGSLTTAASPSIKDLLPKKEADLWISGKSHGIANNFEQMLADGAKPPIPEREDTFTLEELITCAWWYRRFSCRIISSEPDAAQQTKRNCLSDTSSNSAPSLSISGDDHDSETMPAVGNSSASSTIDLGKICDVSSSLSETADGCVIILRDVTDRDRVLEMEREVMSSSIERLKDEEANRFSRHEVKNGVLAAISQVDTLASAIQRGGDPHTFEKMLGSMRTGLSHTLETVLSQALARDVLHGNYVPRTAPCRIEEALGNETLGIPGAPETNHRFPIRTRPAVGFPVIDVDRRLLTLVYRNAISNACKYGKSGGIVSTEIELEDHTLTFRVINEPGPRHADLCKLTRVNEQVFSKGRRLHLPSDMVDSQNATARVSKGDGGWIMKRCAECMQGECSIRFEPERTVFELTCPAPARFDEAFLEDADLSVDVWAVGVEDCEFQRMKLAEIFDKLRIPRARVTILGESDEELKSIGSTLSILFARLPPYARVLFVVDENLDLKWPSTETISGSYMAHCVRKELPLEADARLLALVRSSNDSESDLKLYLDRTHGFLNKAPAEPERIAILRMWIQRFGFKSATPIRQKDKDSKAIAMPAPSKTEPNNNAVAASEIQRLMRLLDKSMHEMPWSELWRWLHRVKGIVGVTRPSNAAGTDLANRLIHVIESTRGDDRPVDFVAIWEEIKGMLDDYVRTELMPQNPESGE